MILGNLTLGMATWLKAHPIGKLFFAPVDVLFSPFDVVVPNMLYMSKDTAARILTDENVQGVPELLVEVWHRTHEDATRLSNESSTSRLASPSTGWSIR
jgi:hypothetical protein